MTVRSMLFVPAAKWSMLVKAAASTADAVCIDLEDSVPAGEKEGARQNVVRALKELDFANKTRIFRIIRSLYGILGSVERIPHFLHL
jgi:citrate lyase beta subunit